MTRHSLPCLFALVALCSCASGSHTLLVEIVTDLCPVADGAACLGERFDTVVVSLDDTLTIARPVSVTDTFLEGQRVAELRELAGPSYLLTVDLLRDGVLVARGTRPILLESPLQVVRVAIQSQCVGVRCPGAGDDPAATECVSGACVDPRCFDPTASREGCGALCESDADCVARVACGEARCIESVCFETLHPERCGAGERCLRDLGCFGGVLEGDPCAVADDCGATDFICCGDECRRPDCNDDNPCTDDACTRAGCVNSPVDAACDDLVFCNGADQCAGGTCSAHAGTPCGGGAICDESSGACASCLADSDCPTQESPLGSCGGFTDSCDESGTQTWRVTTYTCSAGACAGTPRDEPRACARDRTGVSCGVGDSVCGGGICSCSGSVCGSGQYCGSGGCWDNPRFEPIGVPTTSCVDLALGPNPGLLMGYRLYGRPGARVHKYNRHASCPGALWEEGSETAAAPAYINASGVYEVLLDSPTPLACDFPNAGLYEQYADVDGIRVPSSGTIDVVSYNTNGCPPAVSTCAAARTYCP